MLLTHLAISVIYEALALLKTVQAAALYATRARLCFYGSTFLLCTVSAPGATDGPNRPSVQLAINLQGIRALSHLRKIRATATSTAQRRNYSAVS